ncbi:MAG TPA: AI-2E family transporter [Rudaea sp.]|nr:AI-2E family transporter [Rudaea sp.]
MTTQMALRWRLAVLALVVAFAIWLLAPVLTPFAIAAMFAYLFDPLARWLERRGLGRNAAVAIVFLGLVLILILFLLLFLPYLQRQIAAFFGRLPQWLAWFRDSAVPWLNAQLKIDLELPDTQQLAGIVQEHWKEAGGAAASVVAQVSRSGLAVVAWITHLIVVPVAFFYLLRDWRLIIAHVHDLLPRSVEPVIGRLAREADSTLAGFLRGQLSVMLALCAFYAIGLRLVGIDVGPLIGIVAGLISFVPYLGGILGVLMGLIAALVQYHDWPHALLVLGVFGLGHLLEGYVLVPRLVGEKIGLHPLAVIFAILAGGELFGFLGVLLALPIAAVVMVLLRYLHERYRESDLYRSGREAVIVIPGEADAPTIVILERGDDSGSAA